MKSIISKFTKRIDWKMVLISLSIPYLYATPIGFFIDTMMFSFREAITFMICCNLVLTVFPLSIDFFLYHEYVSFFYREPISVSYIFGRKEKKDLLDLPNKSNSGILTKKNSTITFSDFPEIIDSDWLNNNPNRTLDEYHYDYSRQKLVVEMMDGTFHRIDFSEID